MHCINYFCITAKLCDQSCAPRADIRSRYHQHSQTDPLLLLLLAISMNAVWLTQTLWKHQHPRCEICKRHRSFVCNDITVSSHSSLHHRLSSSPIAEVAHYLTFDTPSHLPPTLTSDRLRNNIGIRVSIHELYMVQWRLAVPGSKYDIAKISPADVRRSIIQ
jgi:hypothetical protein